MPIVETFLLWLAFVAARWLTGGRVIATAAMVAAVAGFPHLYVTWFNALAVPWNFFVWALVFMAWEKRSRWKALGMVIALHAAHNVIAVLL